MEIIKPDYVWAYDPGRRTATDYIVLHHAAADGDAQSVHRYHRDARGWAGIAYHYYIRKDGSVFQGREPDWNGGHTEGYNRRSIGLCFEGNFETEEMGEQQLAAGKELLKRLREQYPAASVVRHSSLNRTACPGANFPFAALTAQAPERPSDWAAESVQRWLDMGILQGDGNGGYGFAEPVSLERMITLIERRLAALRE